MDTQSDTARYAAVGIRFRGSYLVQQADYTITIAALEGAALTGKLPPGFLDRAAALRREVEKALDDKTVRASEARQAASAQNQGQYDAKVWVRQVGRRCQSALQLGVDLEPELSTLGCPATMLGILEQMNKTLGLLGKHATDMDKVGLPVQTYIEDGRKLYRALLVADSVQERSRAADMPGEVAAFCAKKGELYIMLKSINNAGHELHAGNPAEAGKFNMTVLHRRGPQTADSESIPLAPVASASAS